MSRLRFGRGLLSGMPWHGLTDATRTRLRNLVTKPRNSTIPVAALFSPLTLLCCYEISTMIRTSGPRGRFAILALLVVVVLSFLFLGPYKVQLPNAASMTHNGQQESRSSGDSQALLTGHAIAPKLGNATAKYVYGYGCGHKSTMANTI